MHPGANGSSERMALAQALAGIAARSEPRPDLWRGYFERLLSGETIGPLPFDPGGERPDRHAISGQYAFRLEPAPGELPGPSSPALQRARQRLARFDGQQVAVGIDLTAISERHCADWLEALSSEPAARDNSARTPPPVVFSLRAEHGGCRALLAAMRGGRFLGVRTAFRVGAEVFGSGPLWRELVQASHADSRIELVLEGDKQPLTDLVGMERPDTVMPLSLFEAPGNTAWLGMQFDLSAIPAEQIERGIGHLRKLVRVGVRLADNLIDAVDWPSGRLRDDALANRRLAAHVTGIGDLVLRHGLNPEDFSTLRLIQRWLRLFKRQLLRESLLLARERGPYAALDAEGLVQALAPRYGEARARRIIARRSPRHRQLLALSPYCVLPRGPSTIPAGAWLNLLPAIGIADNLTMYGSQARTLLGRTDYERLLRSTRALLCNRTSA